MKLGAFVAERPAARGEHAEAAARPVSGRTAAASGRC
jgi:hypothetical protein